MLEVFQTLAKGDHTKLSYGSGLDGTLSYPSERNLMIVFVIGSNGKKLQPTRPAKARKLLRAGRAEVFRKTPFTIKLLYQTGGATQHATRGYDTGSQHIGPAIVDDAGRVLAKAEIELRSSMEKRRLMVKRKEYRRSRRYRKTRYRHPKFRAKTVRRYQYDPKKKRYHYVKVKTTGFETSRKEGWLPPSIQSKLDHHTWWIDTMRSITPDKWDDRIEAARFDIAKMKDPSVYGAFYQRGRMYGYENVKAYVLAKFDYKCPICGNKFDSEHKPRMHHIKFRSKGATDNPDAYAPVCEKCHTPENHENGAILDRLRRACREKEYREPTTMNILRKRLMDIYPDADFTYGNVTNADRKILGLPKSHADDAVAIAAGDRFDSVDDTDSYTLYKQIRTKKRFLHEATPRKGRKEPNVTAKRNNKNIRSKKGFYVGDTVRVKGVSSGYLASFSGENDAYITDIDDNYIRQPDRKPSCKSVRMSLLKLKHHNHGYLIKQKGSASVSHD